MAGLIWNFPLGALILILCGLINPEVWSCHFETDRCFSATRVRASSPPLLESRVRNKRARVESAADRGTNTEFNSGDHKPRSHSNQLALKSTLAIFNYGVTFERKL